MAEVLPADGSVAHAAAERSTASLHRNVMIGIAIALVIRRFPITRADHEARLAALSAARANPDAEGMHP